MEENTILEEIENKYILVAGSIIFPISIIQLVQFILNSGITLYKTALSKLSIFCVLIFASFFIYSGIAAWAFGVNRYGFDIANQSLNVCLVINVAFLGRLLYSQQNEYSRSPIDIFVVKVFVISTVFIIIYRMIVSLIPNPYRSVMGITLTIAIFIPMFILTIIFAFKLNKKLKEWTHPDYIKVLRKVMFLCLALVMYLLVRVCFAFSNTFTNKRSTIIAFVLHITIVFCVIIIFYTFWQKPVWIMKICKKNSPDFVVYTEVGSSSGNDVELK